MFEYEQLNLFSSETPAKLSLLENLEKFVDECCLKLELNREFVKINPLKAKNSYSVWICDPLDWFYNEKSLKETYRIISVTEKNSKGVCQYEIAKSKDTILYDISEKQVMYDYILKTLESEIKNYRPSYSFGCCSSFEKCSDNKKCLHKNNLYARACGYRENLEKGHIFYGINKNI